MPGTRRRVRLVTDWTTGLLFGRDSAELGQLGHPPPLEEQTAGGSHDAGRRARRRRGRADPAGLRPLRDPAARNASALPALASTTERARRHDLSRRGGTSRSTRTGRPSLPSQIRSSGKRMLKVWTERQRGRCRA